MANDLPHDVHNNIVELAHRIGNILEQQFPVPEEAPHGHVPMAAVETVTDYITLVVADILQSFLDAGSEREVTLEELWQPIYDHVKGWAL
jgi:hypothetical protein